MSSVRRQLRPEQAAAAYEIGKHISVTAGPGSGKTTVLVERYLHILRERKLNIDQIVAITFTNRAANEMRERLRYELNDILKTAEPAERNRWLALKRTLDGAVITTIHGFCARLLREFPVEARIDPQFVLLDEHRASLLLEGVVEEVLSQFISAGHVEVSRLTLGVGRAKLAAALVEVYKEIRGQGLSLTQLASVTAASHNTTAEYPNALRELDAAISRYFDLPRLSAKASEKRQSFQVAWTPVRKFLESMPQHDTLAEYCSKIESLRQFRPDKTAAGELSTTIDNLLWGSVSKRSNNYSGLVPQICFDYFAQTYALEMVNLLTVIDARLTEEKQKISALDFDDLEIRALELLSNQAVLTRAREHYKFFLVDEFQDTNDLQRLLLDRLVLSGLSNSANLFIVGDRKQSIYGFRGADVDVFSGMTRTLLEAGGEPRPLHLNFRSQPPLINFFNLLFRRLFQPPADYSDYFADLAGLGFVEHESSTAQRESKDAGPLVELLIATRPSSGEETSQDNDLRELDAIQLANRINLLKLENPELKYSDIALLFRAMTQVHFYEQVFRNANIPYQTVLGRGFYERPEVTDLIQLLRFLDNRTDEIALAAVLRSPLCGISDNALLALRSAPRLEDLELKDGLSDKRSLYKALRIHEQIAYINEQEHDLLERGAQLLSHLINRRHHYTIEDLLRFAVNESEFLTVISANFDGAQRLANVHRLFTLAARFEHSGNHLIRDFVKYVEDFEAIGSRESEGQIDEAANAVKLMTIHQAKGLEFPVVIIPELQRAKTPPEFSFLLDRRYGLTLKVPDGRGNRVAGCTFSRFETRNALREQFESVRLLYVAATRAQDRLILSGTTEDPTKLTGGKDTWLKWIWQALELEGKPLSEIIELDDDVQIRFKLTDSTKLETSQATGAKISYDNIGKADSLQSEFPLLRPVGTSSSHALHRFSVTQLINYQRCARQYYLDRVLQVPSPDELAVWNNAEAPEPPANLTAALKGAVIHRFCELYTQGSDVEECLRSSFREIVRVRQSELVDRLVDIETETAIKDLLPLAKNYLASEVFSRIERARILATGTSKLPTGEPGLWSEVSFRLRRPLGVISGAIDKLLITPGEDGSYEVEIIDFKTNKIKLTEATRPEQSSATISSNVRSRQDSTTAQFSFDFDARPATESRSAPSESLVSVASDYQLQMQAYALAVRNLIPSLDTSRLRVTLHFLEPNLEFQLNDEQLNSSRCEKAIDEAMLEVVQSSEPEDFPVRPATHCRSCNFLRVCREGREFVRSR